MNFLNPLLLAGVAAIAVPLVIHLLDRRPAQRVSWAAMRFLRASLERNQRRLRLENRLLLIMRCLLLAILSLAFARPVFNHRGAPQTCLILLDDSASMGATDGVQTRFARARQSAGSILDSLPAGSAAGVWLVSDTVQKIIAEPTHDLNQARQAIREASLTDRGTKLMPAIDSAFDVLQKSDGRREIYLVTDGQSVGWEGMDGLAEKNNVHLNTVLVSDDAADRNLGISDLHQVSGFTLVDQPLRFDVQVANFGHFNATSVAVRLRVDDEPAMDQAVIDALPSGTVKSVSLFARVRSEGCHTVTAWIDGDHFPVDDQRTIVVDATRRVRILLVDGRADGSETLFLRNAFAAAGNYIEPVVIDPAALATTPLNDFSAVVLADVADFSQSAVAGLHQFVRSGGGLMVFAGSQINTQFYQNALSDLLPAVYGPVVEERGIHLQAGNYDDPLVDFWNDPAAGTLASAQFSKSLTLQSATVAANRGSVVLRFADGSPALMARIDGEGQVLMFASTANTAWNDLPVRPAFVPLLYRSLVTLLQQRANRLNIPAGQRFIHQLPESALGKDVVVIPEKIGSTDRQMGRVAMVDGSPAYLSGEIDVAGVYDVTIHTDPPMKLKFVAQPDAGESRLDPFSKEQFARLNGIARVVRWKANADSNLAPVRAVDSQEIWRALTLVALLIAVFELVIGQRFSESK